MKTVDDIDLMGKKADFHLPLNADLDGVITQPAWLHAKAWKQMFDAFLEEKAGGNFRPLAIAADYRKYIDGKPRFDGVRSFLESRHIALPAPAWLLII